MPTFGFLKLLFCMYSVCKCNQISYHVNNNDFSSNKSKSFDLTVTVLLNLLYFSSTQDLNGCRFDPHEDADRLLLARQLDYVFN